MAVFFAGRVQLKGLPIASHCAEQLKMSSSYFVDLLKHDTGKTFHEYVQFKRIEIAKNWLIKTDKSILQIANGLGFSSSRYFSLLFKRISGCTPDEYRQPN
ncbi:helix-turn-helix domain-containing protein [Bacteroides cellulosilyticus]|jgi:AraC-like DNA-binding protein|uniref:helix-turn-helix domain-containing protein n=1 Tax=Bacteroides cellulosilyticus TaxID=246787 RepID=UPI000E527B7C|nr:AraC family transcriptional regulator [Bacteroides cellulosilyticus]RGU28855.1 AraC family transcriptional regulator [Bacteroides cellulosilyticus]